LAPAPADGIRWELLAANWQLPSHAVSSTYLKAPEPQVRPISVSDGAAPDLVDPIVGFRQWRLSKGSLWSLYSEVPWSTAELRATCSMGRHDPTLAPAKGCSCGIYASYDRCPLTASAGTPDFVAGAVVVWGRVEVHATGMRAEHARIVALEQPLRDGRKRRELDTVAEHLSVPVVPHSRLARVAMAHGLPLEPCLRPGPSGTSGSAESLDMLPKAAALLIVLVGYGLAARSSRRQAGGSAGTDAE
jgi:hypothetical protein